jgi:hypothetical protein
MEKIYDILSTEHKQVADLLQQAFCDGSKETFFKVKAKTDPYLAGEKNFLSAASAERRVK